MELKRLEAGIQYFECQGEKFTIANSLSFNRFEKLQEFSLEFGFSATFKDMMMGLRKQYDLLNQQKLADAIVLNHNLMKGIVALEQKHNVAFRICALFINTDDEDPTEYDEAKMSRKIDIWAKEFDVGFFLHFAIAIVPEFLAGFKLVLSGLSEKEKKDLDISIKS
jgi:hypothetical protein